MSDSAEPLVVEYLRTHSIAELYAEHGVKVSIGTRSYKASFNYDQLAARDADKLACECRGLILATVDGSPFPENGLVGDTLVFARPMDRFFNHGQGAAPEMDLGHPETRVFEKLDGSLCIVYYDHHAQQWCVATRAVPDADRRIGAWTDHTFRSLFEHALHEHTGVSFDDLTSSLPRFDTFCFELTTPYNQIVVRHEDFEVHLLAIRDNVTGYEWCPSLAANLVNIPVAPSHPTRDPAALFEMVSAREPSAHEGVVVRMTPEGGFGPYRRVKVKSEAYVAASRLTESAAASPRSLLSVILDHQDDDVFPMLTPDIRERGEKMKRSLVGLSTEYDICALALAKTASLLPEGERRKAVALSVQEMGMWIAPMIDVFSGRSDSFMGFIARNRKDTGWSDGFLDKILSMVGETTGGV